MKRPNRPEFYDNLVDNQHVLDNTTSFIQDFMPVLSEATNTLLGQTKFCTIELEKLEQYLEYIKREMTKQEVRVKGVKFTFIKYVHDPTDQRSNPLYHDRLSLIVGPIDLLSLAEGNLEGVQEPTESLAMRNISKLNYMNITPPYGIEIPNIRPH